MNADWTIDCGPDGTILFGSQQSQLPFAIAPEIGDASRDTQDNTLPGVDGSLFGRDTVAGQTVAFGLTALGETDEEATALYDAFRRLWRADSIRSTPGAMATLTAPSGRSTFGRPRRITPALYPPGSAAIGITADFATADDLWYEPEEFITVPLASSQGGGLVSPLKSPLVARGYTTAQNAFVVRGTRSTWPVVTIRGPILNPTVEVPGSFRFSAAASLTYDEYLTIDARPGRQSVTRNGDRSAALTRTSTLLPAAVLPVGPHTMTLSGSASGAPTARLVWRPATTTP
jgi:hypothetical protein